MYQHNIIAIRSYTTVRRLLAFFIAALVASGLTALPIEWQLEMAHRSYGNSNYFIPLKHWLNFVYTGVHETNQKYPFIAYGTDWLAFAHFVIAIVFIGPFRDPVKNIWVLEFGMLACAFIFPFAMIAGSVRGIPVFWQAIDCSFGIIGGIILYICYIKAKSLEKLTTYGTKN